MLGRLDWQLLGLWLALRIITSQWAALVSSLRPLTAREQSIAVWPPTAPVGAWLERVLLAPWERWDTQYYLWIATRGYRSDDGTAIFHPLLSWLATPLARLSGQGLLALVIVSSLASALLLLSFQRLARLDLNPDVARFSTLLLFFSPLAFVLFAPYPEGLFLMWAVLCLYWARQRSWWLAGTAALLTTLTRQQGLFLALPLAWELWEAAGRGWRRALANWRSWASLGLVPGGLAIWLVYRAAALNDLRVDFSDLHTLTYSLLISPSADKVVPVQTFMWPWQAVWLAVTTPWRVPEYDVVLDLTLGAGFLVLLALAWRNMRLSYRIYALGITIVSFSYNTGPYQPYMGLPRHLLLAFPVFIGAAPALRGPWVRRAVVAASLVGLFFLIMLYVLEAWVP